MRVLSKLAVLALCALCLQPLCGCADVSTEEGIVNHAIKYATTRALLDMSKGSVVRELPDAQVEVALLEVKDAPDGTKEIVVEPEVISDEMAAWKANDWADHRVDLFFNLAGHFNVICKQAHNYCDVPENYTLTCPDYVVVYNSQKDKGFIVTSNGVYQKTDDPDNPIGKAVLTLDQS
jgi:hypothetical protein